MGYLKLLMRKVPKLPISKVLTYAYLGDIEYEISIDNFYFEDFLRSLTGIYVNDHQYTTFAKTITGGIHPKITYKGVLIGYDNTEHYVHVPDFIASMILLYYPINAYVSGSKLLFSVEPIRKISVFYSFGERVRTPFYSWDKNPPFSKKLEIIMYLIGYSDVVKRNGGVIVPPAEIEKNETFKMYYFLPLLYTAYYLKNKHTFVKSPKVITRVYEEVKDKLKVPNYTLDRLIQMANSEEPLFNGE
ncbi:MAG: hypothetical protein OWS74_04260 [Firmicutes bacterium]|nr:hypothetical protein [Bacillota bacterium]